ncbi:hypothetical protein MTO96_032232 [Rhipicephalus appendiculatus]
MTNGHKWNILKNIAVLAVIYTLQCGGPRHFIAAKPPKYSESRHPAQPLASIQGHHESSPSDLKEGVSVSPETHPMREEKGLLRIPSAKRLEKHFENSKPRHHRHEEKGGRRRPQCGSHQRPSTPAFHGSSAQRPKKPPRYSDARHPRVKKASAYK